jgi:hypothetical protein
MTLPNFLLIGAAKSGTTALHDFLKQHPSIYMSPQKELRYFSNITPPPDGLPKEYIHPGIETLEEYKSFFDGVTHQKVIGESSPMYLYVPGSAERIKATLSEDIKMLAILRNPVDRAFSAYTHALRDWTEPCSSFREALDKEQERINAGWGMLWHYTRAGFYAEQLERYFKIFRRDQIKVVLYDDLVTDAPGLIYDVFEYLEVDPKFIPKTSAHPNVSGFPKNERYHNFIKRLFIMDNPIKRVGRRIVPTSFSKSIMLKLRLINLEKRQIPEDIRVDLCELFTQDIRKLENLIDRDLSSWLNK